MTITALVTAILPSVIKSDTAKYVHCSFPQSVQLSALLQVHFNITKDITGPVYVYYEIERFYQNHRRYFSSKSIAQLQGGVRKVNHVSCQQSVTDVLLPR
jgi:hypothetical protein